MIHPDHVFPTGTVMGPFNDPCLNVVLTSPSGAPNFSSALNLCVKHIGAGLIAILLFFGVGSAVCSICACHSPCC